MPPKASQSKNTVLAIVVISSLAVTFVFAGFFSQPNNINTKSMFYQMTKQSALPVSVTGINETDSLATPPISSSNWLGASEFTTYTYGGYSVQQPNSKQFIFSFPDKTNQGQLSGSDALSKITLAIQKLDFNASFVTPEINARGFDEMVIFAASNTVTYKGTEFGVRMDLKDGFIYGYIQEPNGIIMDVNFKMLKLMPNDGLMHHYSLIMSGSKVSFYIDSKDCGYLNYPSNTDYSRLNFSVLAVVHRFTDNWSSNGDSMTAGNFSFN